MDTEIEVKFLDVNFDNTRQKLESAGAALKNKMRLMRRTIIDFPDERLQKANSYIRVRDEGDKVTVTYKQFKATGIDGAKEITTVVDSYENACAILLAAGLASKAVQESKRETWVLNGVEIALDEWPWLKPYVEIEGASSSAVQKVAVALGFSWDAAVFGDVSVAYRAVYDVSAAEIGRGDFVFGEPVPKWLESKRRK